MARADWPRDARDVGPFSAALKCCTYEPFLPNFSIGRILLMGVAHQSARAMANVLAEAGAQGRMTPLGLMPRAGSEAVSLEFGRNPMKRCQFLSATTAVCTIWRERPSVCRSYFCVSDQGSSGQALWKRAEVLGNEAEWTLAHEVLWEMGFTQDETENFAEWTSREPEFYMECARRAFDGSGPSP